jgi:acetylornithine deacetylase/succinyl-diaminopimelate desuccinylase-like protein
VSAWSKGFDLESFHERAVRTPSHEDVTAMRDLLCSELDAHGEEPRVDDAGNVLATRGGESGDTDGDRGGSGNGGPHLVLNTHVDTVPPHVPYSREDDTVRGRGACDAKGPLAALLCAFLACSPERGRVTLAVTPDEEVYSTGAAALVSGPLDADGFIVGEPTGLDVCTAAKGRFEGTLTLSGVAAHAAEPDSGVSAIAALEPVLGSVRTFDDAHGPGEHGSLGAPTLTPTLVEGGAATNQVPAECRLTLDRRSVPPETAEGFREALLEHVRGAVSDVEVEFDFTERPTPFLEAFATDPDEPLVETLANASGGAVRPFGAATEASYFAREAPTVVFGPGVLADEEGAVAHAEREYIDVGEVHRAADAVRETLDTLLG